MKIRQAGYLCNCFMKKIFASISFICYFAVTSGIVINSHYCMDRLIATTLFDAPVNKCGECGMDIHKSHGCCKSEVKVVKMEQDQNINPVLSFAIPALTYMPTILSQFIAASFYNIDEQRHFHNHSPPLLSGQDTYLQINVFRI